MRKTMQVIHSRTPPFQATSLLDIILHKIMSEERWHPETIIEPPLTRILNGGQLNQSLVLLRAYQVFT